MWIDRVARHLFTLWQHWHRASALHDVFLLVPVCLPTDAWPGWVELGGWFLMTWFTCPPTVTHPSTNWPDIE